MDSNGRASPAQKNASRSRSRSPQGGDDRRGARGRPRNRSRERSEGGGSRRTAATAVRRVYVANIPFDSKWTDVKDLFREQVGDVTYVQLFEDETSKFRGCGVVEFKDMSSVQKAIDVLHRYEYKGRKLVVKEDYDLERDKAGRLIPSSGSRERSRDRPMNDGYRGGGGGGGGGSGDMGGNFNTYGLSPQFLDSLGINSPLSCKVFIANLDFKVTSKKLAEVFKMAGKIMNIDLKTDLDGNSKGHGVVEFDHPVEAVQAISMFNGQKLYNRIMSVRMDRFDIDEAERNANKLPSGLGSIGKGLGVGGQAIQLSGVSNSMGLGNNLPPNAMNLMGGAGFGLNPMAAAAAAAMSASMGNSGLSASGLSALGLSAGLGSAGLAGAAGLGNAGLGLGLGSGGLAGSASERGLLGNSLGGSLGAGLGLGNNSSLGLGSGNSSGLGFGLSGAGGSSGGGGGLMGNLGGSSSMSGLGGNSGLSGGLGGSSSNMGGGYGDMGDMSYDRSGPGLSGGGGDGYHGSRSSDTVQVRGLPSNYNWQSLRDRFRDIGDVRYTELKGRGAAVIRFNSERDAQRAVDLMHGSRIEGRPIEVRLY